MRADTANAPMAAPGPPRERPAWTGPEHDEMVSVELVQRTAQKSRTEVAIHGQHEGRGQCEAGWRRMTRPTSVAMR